MARVLFTYAARDRELVDRIEVRLEQAGHTVVALEGLRLSGEGLKDRAVMEITAASHVVAVLSRDSWATRGFAFELGLVRTFEITLQRNVLVAIAVDDAPVPTVLGSRPTVRMSSAEPEASFETLLEVLRQPVVDEGDVERPLAFLQASALATTREAPPAWTGALTNLAAALASQQLVLFMGAGVSCSAGIPTWQTLVDRILSRVLDRTAMAVGFGGEELAKVIRTSTKSSDLILAQHARRELGSDFHRTIQEELYRGASGRSTLLAALGELIASRRPKAAITYNFDVFLEQELRRRGIPYQSVTRDGQRAVGRFPVFHVHGVIRPSGRVTRRGLVFAESEFHAESLDPYRWSALVQLSHLAHSTCLFVGASMQDPNLRRLLEVVKTRSPEDVPQHYVVYRRTDPRKVADAQGVPTGRAMDAAKVVDRLVEGDLNDLGLQVIWVRSHDDVPAVVSQLANAALPAAA